MVSFVVVGAIPSLRLYKESIRMASILLSISGYLSQVLYLLVKRAITIPRSVHWYSAVLEVLLAS